MSLDLREVCLSEFEAIHRHLLSELDPGIPPARWRRLLDPGWDTGEEAAGFALWEGARPVGFVATLHQPAPSDGRSRICSISSWIVLEGWRGSGLRLLAPVLGRRDLTLVNLTPTPEVLPIFRGMGFEPLERHRHVAPLRPDLLLRRRLGEGPPEGASRDAGGVEWSVRKRGRVPSVRLHHVDDPDAFLAGLPGLWRRWVLRDRAPVLEYDARILRGRRAPWARVRELPAPRLFRSPDRTPDDLASERHTEFVLLDL